MVAAGAPGARPAEGEGKSGEGRGEGRRRGGGERARAVVSGVVQRAVAGPVTGGACVCPRTEQAMHLIQNGVNGVKSRYLLARLDWRSCSSSAGI